jgi:peptide/nickel transport system permease protein
LGARVSLIFGLLILTVFAAFSAFPSLIAPYPAKEMFAPWLAPSTIHLLGTNDMGYDIFSELVFAARNTLTVGLAAAAVSIVAGTAVGVWAGCAKGWKRELAGGIINVFLLVPMLPAAIVVAAYLGPGLGNTMLTIGLLGWCPTARAVRARAAQLNVAPFVESLAVLRIPRARILYRHILANLMEVVLARAILSVASCMMMEATLSFIGLGDPSSVTWGGMVNLAYRNGGFARGAYNWVLAPGFCIMACVLAFTCVNRYFEARATEVDNGGASYLD